jgi:hypothetical protein
MRLSSAFGSATLAAVALATIDRSILARLERHFGVSATCGTHCRIHLPAGTKASVATTTAFLFSCRAATWTTLGLVGEAFAGEELLLTGSERETVPTIGALELFVGETHWMTSFLNTRELNLGHPIL